MKKTLGLLLLLVLALGIAPMLASADCTGTPGANVCEDGGVVLIDGDDTNPDPLDGSIVVDSNAGTVCADSTDPDDEDYDPSCLPA